MPYRFVENEVAVNYMGIPIYHVYRNNYEDGGWREYWFTKEPFGCEDDDDAFDIRDQAEYDPRIAPTANLVKMIRDGHFGPLPEDYDRYVDEENSQAGVCPVCESRQLEYGILEVLDASVAYPFTCENCGASGNEYDSLAFDGFSVD